MHAEVALLQEVGSGSLEVLSNAGGNVALSRQDPWEPLPSSLSEKRASDRERVR